MYLNLRPAGRDLTADQAKVLDDEFFKARPLAHFSSRIASLLDSDFDHAVSESRVKFHSALGLDTEEDLLHHDHRVRQQSVALEAIALRQHCAEALLRFLAVVLPAPQRDGRSTWAAIAEGPTRMSSVVEAVFEALEAAPGRLESALFPPTTTRKPEHALALEHAADWIDHAIRLLTSDAPALNAANNKIKHGLAVATRDDVRIELVMSRPPMDGTIPVSAFGPGKSVPIFDRPLMTFISRPSIKPKPGLEAHSLRIDVPTALAETWMMANVYAALFHVAAQRHFGRSAASPDIAPYPTLVVGRSPEAVLAGQPIGSRTPITDPPDGITKPRPAGLFFYNQFVPMRVDFDSKTSAVIVDG